MTSFQFLAFFKSARFSQQHVTRRNCCFCLWHKWCCHFLLRLLGNVLLLRLLNRCLHHVLRCLLCHLGCHCRNWGHSHMLRDLRFRMCKSHNLRLNRRNRWQLNRLCKLRHLRHRWHHWHLRHLWHRLHRHLWHLVRRHVWHLWHLHRIHAWHLWHLWHLRRHHVVHRLHVQSLLIQKVLHLIHLRHVVHKFHFV
ncbi:hypothetical protein D3C87_1265880 [compost metagenome]